MRSSWSRSIRWPSLVVLSSVTALAGCGGGGDGRPAGRGGGTGGWAEEEKGAGGLDGLQEAVQTARNKALAAGAKEFASETFAQAERYLESARTALEKRMEQQARTSFGSARGYFTKAAEEAERIKRARQTAEADRAAALEARKRADEAKAKELVPDSYAAAEAELRDAERQWNDPARVKRAGSRFRQAADMFDGLVQEAKHAARTRDSALRAKESAQKNRELAQKVEASKYAPVAWEESEQVLREADDSFAACRFDDAKRYYGDAAVAYIGVVQTARTMRAHQERIAAADAAAAKKAEAPAPEAPGKAGQPAEAEGPAAAGTEPGAGEAEPGVAKAAPPPAVGGADAVIAAHVAKLFAVPANYADGFVELDYSHGPDLERDCVIKVGSPNPPQFKGSEGVAPVANLVYSFAGRGGTGRVIHKAVFDGLVEVTFVTKMDLIKAGPLGIADFRTYLMYDRDTWYGTSFGAKLLVNGRRRSAKPSPNAEMRKAPSRWFILYREVPMAFKFAWSDAEKAGTLSVSYDDDKVRNAARTRERLKGRVGWEWKNCRFYLQQVKIRGRLDRDWLTAELKKLGVEVPPAGGGAAAGAGTKKAKGLDF